MDLHAKELDTKIQCLHIAILIVEDDNLKNSELNLTEGDLQVSDDDIQDTVNSNRNNNLTLDKPIEPHTEKQEQEWNAFVKE
ncbi:15194_t:CDS:2 [Funneliformis geosporum]|nr:15194_t:CDS:2 [Funneliformis geosporum]